MSRVGIYLKAGDWVEVKSPLEIAETLDANGTLDGLPFMPEMVRYCGHRLRVLRWAEKTCFEESPYNYVLRELREDDVVFLEGLRCDGADHDGCQRLCLYFWKIAWLRKTEAGHTEPGADPVSLQMLRGRLRTKAAPDRYFCQSTEMARATLPQRIDKRRIMLKCWRDLSTGAVGIRKMFRMVVMPVARKIRDALVGRPWLLGNLTKTPVGTLNLQPGELVEVLPLEEMRKTLDRKGRNRGLICDIELGETSGNQYRVLTRLDRFISDSTGGMRKMEATVILSGVHCLCSRVVGGCSRLDYSYYREVWLKRVEGAESVPVETKLER